MIISFKNKDTESIFKGVLAKKLPHDIQQVARRKLIMLDSSHRLADLKAPPSNHLEKMEKYRKGDWNIRINDQFRIVFTWTDGNCYDVEIIDYH
ncbi:MAG: type II toxin-antitoxin system RelE/ParE family toxin [Bacillota bacterium]|nr:type II toxin-antitoxin system RelE/ParE family toxin [Bacillota bacterium]